MVIQAQLGSGSSGFALGAPQDLVMEGNAFGFNNLCFVAQQPKQQQQLLQSDQFQDLSRQKMHSFLVDSSVHHFPQSNVNDRQPMTFPQSISVLNEKQRIEIDRFISLQNERLRVALQEQRKQQMALLLKKYESKTQLLLKQKEEEISNAAKRTMELQEFLARMENENQAWKRIARENEAMVASLNSTIERLRETANLSSSAADDAASCCHNGKEEKELGKSERMVCRCCNSRKSCMIMIPCRHLSSCKDCEAVLDFCPVCTTVKKATIEALI